MIVMCEDWPLKLVAVATTTLAPVFWEVIF
jgi:hypothetical protein